MSPIRLAEEDVDALSAAAEHFAFGGPRPLNVLLLEDCDDDALLVELALRQAGWLPHLDRCQDEAGFRALLEAGGHDLVISDFALPTFSGLGALAIAHRHDPDLPFILVSGMIGEDVAVQAMRSGAHDYLMKASLARLAPAVERELGDADARRRRRVAERRLAGSEQLQRTILESISDAVLAVNAHGTVVRANRAAATLLGQTAEHLAGQPIAAIARFLDPATRAALPDPVAAALRGASVACDPPPLLDIGAGYRVDLHVTPMRGPSGSVDGAVLVLRDVTSQLERAQDLRQAQKLAVLGQLAGSVAHDFNNLLTAILGHTDLIATDPTLSEGSRKGIRQLGEAAERGVQLVARMMDFARTGSSTAQAFWLDVEARIVADLFAAACPRNIRLVLALGSTACSGFPAQVHSALLNLLVNARDAMPHGGVIRIVTNTIDVDEAMAAQARPALRPGRWQQLVVADEGSGMPPEVVARLFEPFFTTKGQGRGTGLGLTSVLGCVRDHHGGVLVETAPGQGTRVTLLFPGSAGFSLPGQ